MRSVTLVLPYYENRSMLALQLRHLSRLPKSLRSRIHLVIVDDGSPVPPPADRAFYEIGLAGFSLYRILIDVRWNWIAARNLGALKSPTEWIILTDIDHLVTQRAFELVVKAPLSGDIVYRFTRRLALCQIPYKPHPNSFLMTRVMFDLIGGYDERFSGLYGSDGEFRKRVRSVATEVVVLNAPLLVYTSVLVRDAATTRYSRKEPADRDGKACVRELIRLSATPHRYTFPWQQVI